MAEYKQYVTQEQENGTVNISEDVIATIVAHAVTDVDGIYGISNIPGTDIKELINKNWGKGMKIQIAEDNSVSISCNVNICYDCSVIDVAANAQAAIVSSVESMTGVKVTAVNLNVCGITRK